MVNATNPLALGAVSAGNQILGRDFENKSSANPLAPREEKENNRTQPNQDYRDRVEISVEGRQRLGAINAAASNRAVASPLEPVQNATNQKSLDPSQTTPGLRGTLAKATPNNPPNDFNTDDTTGPQTVEQTIQSSVAGQLVQSPNRVNAQGRNEVQSSPRKNLIQQQININTDTQLDQGNSRQAPAGQNPVAQQIRQNTNPEPVGSNPRAALAGQNPIEETVRQNNAAAEPIQETAGAFSTSPEQGTQTGNELGGNPVPNQQREISAEPEARRQSGQGLISPGVKQVREEATGKARTLPEQSIISTNEAPEIRQQNSAEARGRGEVAVQLPEVADEQVLETPQKNLASRTIGDTSDPNNQRELGETFTENVQEARAQRAKQERQTESVESEEQQHELQNQENRNRGQLAEQTQIGRNINRLI